ncbi:hypothetical protein EYF80_005832 [Liparis tanakae]|uniref:Uncharacterized protein n=1 Tax=Liparis tanakae TaxID=230148 RepID=A0A4Z2J1Y9_9TELE|nr:hypothetical protein EYF80_005832 [Liparis tanakae]
MTTASLLKPMSLPLTRMSSRSLLSAPPGRLVRLVLADHSLALSQRQHGPEDVQLVLEDFFTAAQIHGDPHGATELSCKYLSTPQVLSERFLEHDSQPRPARRPTAIVYLISNTCISKGSCRYCASRRNCSFSRAQRSGDASFEQDTAFRIS